MRLLSTLLSDTAILLHIQNGPSLVTTGKEKNPTEENGKFLVSQNWTTIYFQHSLKQAAVIYNKTPILKFRVTLNIVIKGTKSISLNSKFYS